MRFCTRIIGFLYQDRVEETTVGVGGELLTDKSDGDLAAVVPELNKLVPELVKISPRTGQKEASTDICNGYQDMLNLPQRA